MHLFIQIVHWLEALADKVPLTLFIFLGALIEEVIAPIPSPSLLTLAGSVAVSQGLPMISLIWLALIGAVGKALGGWVLYYLGDKAEDIILKKWGKFFGITHSHIESFGSRFHKGHRDIFVLTAIRALPIIPSAPVSIACGVIKLDIKVYLLGTFLGNIPRNLIFLYFGYSGVQVFSNIVGQFDQTESLVQIGIFVAVAALIAWSYWKRKKHS
ncbi:MAG: VTT domain-containing protein [Candidatus Abawacabacteria bacterium]|nr:VTT domain-containing protein [Candidatus Abawacabacteria bacterium]